METIKANILKAISEEQKDVFDFATKLLAGFKSAANNTPETKIANSMFNAIIRFSDSRLNIDRQLDQMARMIKSERTRLRNGSGLDSCWVNSSKYEEAIQETNKLWHEVHTLSYIIGLTGDEIRDLANKIHYLTEYTK